MIVPDASVLIDHFRKSDKTRSLYHRLEATGDSFALPAVAHFEVWVGVNHAHRPFWQTLMQQMTVLPFDAAVADVAVKILHDLTRARTSLDMSDLFIAATSMHYHLPLATLNRAHFERVDGLLLTDVQ